MMRKKIFFLYLPACMALFLAGCHSVKRWRHKGKCCGHSKALSGRAEVKPVKRGGPYGTAAFKNAGRHKLEVTAEIKGLPPGGQFGFHVHEWGSCGNNALMAGGHFNPHKSRHGGAEGKPRHLGDLGNLASDEKGRAIYRAEIHGKAQKFFGRSLVIHAGRDDLKTQPSGGSKGRIACGVITAAPAFEGKTGEKIRFAPHKSAESGGGDSQKGAQQGVKIVFVEKGGLWEKTGFQEGDILKKVGGLQAVSGRQILEIIERERTVKVLIERDGKEMAYTYRLPSGSAGPAVSVKGAGAVKTAAQKAVAQKAVAQKAVAQKAVAQKAVAQKAVAQKAVQKAASPPAGSQPKAKSAAQETKPAPERAAAGKAKKPAPPKAGEKPGAGKAKKPADPKAGEKPGAGKAKKPAEDPKAGGQPGEKAGKKPVSNQ